jgi:hypothetical protein
MVEFFSTKKIEKSRGCFISIARPVGGVHGEKDDDGQQGDESGDPSPIPVENIRKHYIGISGCEVGIWFSKEIKSALAG